jgi:hypothetical protein
MNYPSSVELGGASSGRLIEAMWKSVRLFMTSVKQDDILSLELDLTEA